MRDEFRKGEVGCLRARTNVLRLLSPPVHEPRIAAEDRFLLAAQCAVISTIYTLRVFLSSGPRLDHFFFNSFLNFKLIKKRGGMGA